MSLLTPMVGIKDSRLGSNVSGNLSNGNDFGPKHTGDTVYFVLNVGASVILFLVICCGNSLILYLAVKHRGEQNTSIKHLLIAGMSLHDIATGVVVTPIHIMNVLELQISGMKCLAFNVFTFVVHVVSGYTPLLLAIERFVAIIFPFRYHIVVTERKVCVSLVLVWTYGVLVGCMPVMGWNDLDRGDPITYCHVEHYLDGRYLGFVYMLNVVPCMIGQIGLYAKIIKTARDQARRISIENKRCAVPAWGPPVQRQERRGLLMLAMTSVFFILSYLPVIIETAVDFNLYMSKSLDGDMWSTELFFIGDIMILTNAAINPVFYAYSNKNFRIKIKQMFKRTHVQDIVTS